MATSAFRSSTRRASGIGAAPEDAGSASKVGTPAHHRRARSLSRYSGRFPPAEPADEITPGPTPRRKFVNTVRGSGFPEVSLDDLANEFFPVVDWELEEATEKGRDGGRAGRRASDAGFAMQTESSKRRGRSISRKGDLESSRGSAGKGAADASARRRRSLSVARYRSSDLESQMSSLTDEEGSSIRHARRGSEKTIRTICAQKKIEHPSEDGEVNVFYDAMRKEVRHAVQEIRTELERVMVKPKTSAFTCADDIEKNVDAVQAIADIRRNYTMKLEESEKRKQQLLAELMAEEHRGLELTKMVKELLPEPKQIEQERPLRARKRINDKTRMSRCLTEEAERYIEGFISNLEDTDLSSFDEERSDTSSTLGGSRKTTDILLNSGIAESAGLFEKATLPMETDGVILPWLQWETATDNSPASKSKFGTSNQVIKLCQREQETSPCYDSSHVFTSSYGSCSPKGIDFSGNSRETKACEFGEIRSYIDNLVESRPKRCPFQIDKYSKSSQEEMVFDTFRHRQRIDGGELILCNGSSNLYGLW